MEIHLLIPVASLLMLIIIRCSIKTGCYCRFGETVKPFSWQPGKGAEVQKQIKIRSEGALAHYSYTAEVEMVIEGKATGALVLFYNDSASPGILANSENILAISTAGSLKQKKSKKKPCISPAEEYQQHSCQRQAQKARATLQLFQIYIFIKQLQLCVD